MNIMVCVQVADMLILSCDLVVKEFSGLQIHNVLHVDLACSALDDIFLLGGGLDLFE